MSLSIQQVSFQIFVAEHIFGKPKETVETTLNVNDFNIKDIIKFKD